MSVIRIALPAILCGVTYAQPRDDGPRDPTAEEQASMNDLGERFVAALRAGDEKKARECWSVWEVVETEIAKLPADKRPPEAVLAKYRDYVKKRDEVVALTIPLVIRFVKDKCADPQELKLVQLTGKVRSGGGRTSTSSFRLTMRNAVGDEFHYRIDDGGVFKGKWHFADKPDGGIEIRRDGKSTGIPLIHYATDDEKRKLEAAKKNSFMEN